MLKKLGIIILVLLVSALVVAYAYLNTITKNVIESYGTKITGTGVSVGFVSVSPFSGKISVHNLTVKSPNGFKADHVLKIGSISSELLMSSALSETIVIKSLKIDEAEIIHELSLAGYNIEAIKGNAAKPSGGSDGGKSKKVIIKDLLITSGKVNVFSNIIGENSKQEIPLPDIHLEGIGEKENGVIISSAVFQVLQAITNSISAQDINLLKGQMEGIGKEFKDNVEKFKGLLNR